MWDHTIASAYSVRGVANGRVSAPVRWDEIEACTPDDFTIATMPARFAELGDLHADLDAHPFDLSGLVELAAEEPDAGEEPPAP